MKEATEGNLFNTFVIAVTLTLFCIVILTYRKEYAHFL